MFESDQNILHVPCPILQIHCEDDEVTQYDGALALYDHSINNRSELFGKHYFVSYPEWKNYGHSAVYKSPDFSNVVKCFFEDALDFKINKNNMN